MPVTSVDAPNVATGGVGAETVQFQYEGGSSTTFRLFATNGTETVEVGRANFTNLNIFNSGSGTATFSSVNGGIGALEPGNYEFYVVADNLVSRDVTGPATGETFICFMQGTRIGTPSGPVPIEELRIGDRVLTADGRAEPILFIGRQAVMPKFSLPEDRNPILIRAGALGDNVPVRDLRVSAHHGIVVDGVLCFARALVNGISILQDAAAPERFTYFNIETAAHEVLLAEGAPVESFCDNVPRVRFDNHAEFQALFPDGREVGEMDLPLAKSHRQVPAATLARLDARAQALYGTVQGEAA